MSRARNNPFAARAWRRWTWAEIDRLREMHDARAPFWAIADTLGRSEATTAAKARALGLPRRPQGGYRERIAA